MGAPHVTIDTGKLEHNARTITRTCAKFGIQVTGVTKGTCGSPDAARAMLRGGVTSVGESRLENIARLRSAGVDAVHMLLRTPSLSRVHEVVERVDISLNSESAVVAALSDAAQSRGLVHEIIVMVDLGDLREGVWPDDLVPFVRDIIGLPGIRIVGLGTNLSCYAGVIPSRENMEQLVEHAREIESVFELELDLISGGNSSSLPLIASGDMPRRVNHARIGEAILLGVETVRRTPWPDTHQDAFVLHAEIIELKAKPSVPIGATGEDAFGARPRFDDRGDIIRAILNIGREDIEPDGVKPFEAKTRVLGATSDALIVDVTAVADSLRVGDTMVFGLNYPALLAVMSSEYVQKRLVRARKTAGTSIRTGGTGP